MVAGAFDRAQQQDELQAENRGRKMSVGSQQSQRSSLAGSDTPVKKFTELSQPGQGQPKPSPA